MQIPVAYLSLEWNPNHRIRYYLMGPGLQLWRLLTVRFSNKDQSVYLAPAFDHEYCHSGVGPEKLQVIHRPGAEFHISLHESGVVNFASVDSTLRVREPIDATNDVRHVVTLQINTLQGLPRATLDEFNDCKGGYFHDMIFGFPIAPLMFSVFCDNESAKWTPCGVGNAPMRCTKVRMKGKAFNFTFVKWQHLGMPRGVGDIALCFGDHAWVPRGVASPFAEPDAQVVDGHLGKASA